jgi:hypothetical protein
MHTSPLVTLTGCIVGRSSAHTVWGWRRKGIKELNHPARAAPPPPITKLIRNEEETIRYIICAAGA